MISPRRHLLALREADRELARVREKPHAELRSADQDAVATALVKADEKAARHNDLIAAMKDLIATFATRESVDARFSRLETLAGRLAGGIAVVSIIGVANLVKLWT